MNVLDILKNKKLYVSKEFTKHWVNQCFGCYEKHNKSKIIQCDCDYAKESPTEYKQIIIIK